MSRFLLSGTATCRPSPVARSLSPNGGEGEGGPLPRLHREGFVHGKGSAQLCLTHRFAFISNRGKVPGDAVVTGKRKAKAS